MLVAEHLAVRPGEKIPGFDKRRSALRDARAFRFANSVYNPSHALRAPWNPGTETPAPGRCGQVRRVLRVERHRPAATADHLRLYNRHARERGLSLRAEPSSESDYRFFLVDITPPADEVTGDAEDRRIAVHGLDAGTGRPLWRADLPNGICAAIPLKSRLVCAASVATDPATGLGTRWRISLLDPATGRETRGADFTGWLTLIHVDGDRVLLVEQRQPAPHAVLTGLDADLRQRWHLDLSDQQQHAGLFSDNRIYYRKLPIPDGPALDRPRIRKVADGLTALWSGQTTAFVDLRSGKLTGMPRCSRLVDDGERLWCNDGPLAVSYSYTLRKLHQTALNTRLAFPDRDPRAGDVTDPVFLQSDGRAVRVDLATGKTLGPLAQTRNGSAFGMITSPKATFVAGLTLLSDSSTMFAVDARSGKLHWQGQKPRSLGDAWAWREKLLFTDSVVRVLDPADGKEQAAYRQRHGLYTTLVGDVLVGIGPDEVARLTDP